MNCKILVAAAGIGGALLSALPAAAQFQVCGVPPLPACQPQVRERVIIERERDRDRDRDRDFDRRRGRAERLSDICRTRTLRCRTDDPRPIGARCTCEDPDGERIIGRIQ
jgi:hypothetical protein